MQTNRLVRCIGWVLAISTVACSSERASTEATSAAPASTTSPYAGMSSATVPSLTVKEVDDLTAGRGLGMARAAELNGYPGPRHVLDLSSQLELDRSTVERAEQLFQEMQSAAQPLGAQVVALEKSLGESFAAQRVDEGSLQQQLDALAALTSQLRGIHLRAHIQMKASLSPQQVARYQELRGYPAASSGAAAAGADSSPHSAHHHAM